MFTSRMAVGSSTSSTWPDTMATPFSNWVRVKPAPVGTKNRSSAPSPSMSNNAMAPSGPVPMAVVAVHTVRLWTSEDNPQDTTPRVAPCVASHSVGSSSRHSTTVGLSSGGSNSRGSSQDEQSPSPLLSTQMDRLLRAYCSWPPAPEILTFTRMNISSPVAAKGSE